LGPPQESFAGVRPRGRSLLRSLGQTAYTDPVPEASLVYGLRSALAAFCGFHRLLRCLASRILPPCPCCYQRAQRRESWSLAPDRTPVLREKRQVRLGPGGMDADRAGINHVLLRFPKPGPGPGSPRTGSRNSEYGGCGRGSDQPVRGRTAPASLGAVPIRRQGSHVGITPGASRCSFGARATTQLRRGCTAPRDNLPDFITGRHR
jgi:hypothetical protein